MNKWTHSRLYIEKADGTDGTDDTGWQRDRDLFNDAVCVPEYIISHVGRLVSNEFKECGRNQYQTRPGTKPKFFSRTDRNHVRSQAGGSVSSERFDMDTLWTQIYITTSYVTMGGMIEWLVDGFI